MLSLEVEVWATVFGFPLATPFSFSGFPFPILGEVDGLQEGEGVTMTIAPNPTSGPFTLTGAAGCQAVLWSADGQKVREWNVVTQRETVALGTMPGGLYFLELVGDDRREVLRVSLAR